MDFRTLSIIDLAEEVNAGKLTAVELTTAALKNIKELDGELNCFCAVDEVLALEEAKQIDQRIAAGETLPLAGIPIGIKDLEDAKGYVTTFGSQLYTDVAKAETDSILVARLKAAGCVVVGKTNTPEFGHKGKTDNVPFGITRNPWNTDYTPGGSSGGSAAAVAAGIVPLVTGSDGGGSIRIPASICGLSAIKCSQGRVPLGDKNAPGSGLLTVKGPMAKTTVETAYALDCVVGEAKTDIFSLPDKTESWFDAATNADLPETVIYSPTMGYVTMDKEIAEICDKAIDKLRAAGVNVIVIDDIWPTDPVHDWLVFWFCARARAQAKYIGSPEWDKIDPSLQMMIEIGHQQMSGPRYAEAIDAAHNYNYQLEQAFQTAPLIITPATAGHTPKVDEDGLVNGEQSAGWVGFTMGINMTRNPAGVVAVDKSSVGLPVALQVIGRQRDDVEVIKAMAAMEALYGSFSPAA